jgi:hypothetical protein
MLLHTMLDIRRPISNIFIVLRMAQEKASCLSIRVVR